MSYDGEFLLRGSGFYDADIDYEAECRHCRQTGEEHIERDDGVLVCADGSGTFEPMSADELKDDGGFGD